MGEDASGRPLGERLRRGEGPEFAGLVQALGEAIIVRARSDRIIFANPAALRLLGLAERDELIDQPLSQLLARFTVHDARGRPVPRDQLPSVRLLESGLAGEPRTIRLVRRDTGTTRWVRVAATPLRDATDTVVAAVTTLEDVTATRTAEVHTEVLAESGRLLAASFDYHQSMRNAARAALPGLADWCMIERVAGGEREQVVIAHVDPDMEPVAARMRALEPRAPTPESTTREVLATGRAVLLAEVTDSHLRRVAVSDEQLELLRRLRIRSGIIAPMVVSSRTIGVISFFTSSSGRRLTETDLAIAEQLGRRTAVVVDHARLHTRLAEVVDALQQSLRPAPVPAVPGWEIGALWRPAERADRIEVGGDFYEVFDTAGTPFATIGDVTGHGVHAAALTPLLRHGARFASHLEPDPVAIIRRLDEELRRRDEGAMATALCAALSDHSLLMCSAGHPPALIIDGEGRIIEAPSSGPLLGAFPDSAWHQERVTIADGSCALLYTDGVTETEGATERFGTTRLREFLGHHAGSAPQALLHALAAELDRFRGGEATDDIAALALRPRPV